MGGNANPVTAVKKVTKAATSTVAAVAKPVVSAAKEVVAPVVKLAQPVVEPVVKAATQVVSAVPIVGEPVAKAINQVTEAVGVTTPPAPTPSPSAAPVEQAVAGDSTSETITNPQVALTGKAGEAPGQSGGEVEVKKGAGRLNKNVQRSRAQFRTPSANTGAAGSSIRI